MKTSPPRYLLALVCLLVFLLTGQASVQGYVLCIGADGHTALEFAGNKACNPKKSPLPVGHDHHEEEASHFDGDSHCGPCLDIPATLELTSSRQQQSDDLATAALPLPVPFVAAPVFVSILTNDLLAHPPPRLSQSILIHRTVVLLN
ncbi:hypothetical protein [Desulfuromonas sp. AOP6]|uniref:hypothetical protein n=1 Tax=Desulfuromonas sp. AOP6 TaxID=1566351 RepID=UPI00127345F5|nr:hypothetical protein [Desulfuromonas sp. AOP6]BCA80864.1 hypothetical protein AOP6_2651 [Desulfuromonas sp. AOP6]